jgi:hypothetical protein
MPFTVIEGTYHLVGRTRAGNPSGFEPDGDSMQFKPSNPALLAGLTRTGAPARLTSIGSTQLRFEGSTRSSCTSAAPSSRVRSPTTRATSSPASSTWTRCSTAVRA